MNEGKKRWCWCCPCLLPELQVCILNERIGWRAALHNQQAPTPEDPTVPPAAVDGRAEQTQCQAKTPLLTTTHQAGGGVQGGKVEEEMWMVRNNKRVGEMKGK